MSMIEVAISNRSEVLDAKIAELEIKQTIKKTIVNVMNNFCIY